MPDHGSVLLPGPRGAGRGQLLHERQSYGGAGLGGAELPDDDDPAGYVRGGESCLMGVTKQLQLDQMERDAIEELVAAAVANARTPWEVEFANGIQDRLDYDENWRPTEKQRDRLEEIAGH